jgi:cytochrome c-type biogenesis protein CcmF
MARRRRGVTVIAELGNFALALALAIALAQSAIPLYGAAKGDAQAMRVGAVAAETQFLLILFAFGALVWAFLSSDFSVSNVYENSHSLKPTVYKIAGAWGNHEGSMVLWVLILAAFGASVARFGGQLPEDLKARVLAIQGFIGFLFLAFIQFTSNPFARVTPAPIEGLGLNPILQDPGLAMHPPLLYFGYVGFSIAFSFAVAALLGGQVHAAWARWVRPWTLAAWVSLTLGIGLGSWWAYYELGWGGFWFWDPVENASLMPWLAGTALLHSAIVVERRDTLKSWTVLLAIVAFGFSLVGTFLVRSGVLTSVHAFANDPERGLFILAILVLLIGGALTIYALKAPRFKSGGAFAPISRESALLVNNLFLSVALATVFLGTIYPLIMDAAGLGKISVGPPFFVVTFGPIALLLLALVPFGPFLAWRQADLEGIAQRLSIAAALSIGAAIMLAVFMGGASLLACVSAGFGVWVIAGTFTYLVRWVQSTPRSLSGVAQAIRRMPRSVIGMSLAHGGVGVLVLGISLVSGWQEEAVAKLQRGGEMTLSGYVFKVADVVSFEGPNYGSQQAVVSIAKDGRRIAVVYPETRTYPARATSTTEAGIHTSGVLDLYVALGDRTDGPEGPAWTVRVYYKPGVPLIWYGVIITALGGCASLSDRRFRIGAPSRRRGSAMASPADA